MERKVQDSFRNGKLQISDYIHFKNQTVISFIEYCYCLSLEILSLLLMQKYTLSGI